MVELTSNLQKAIYEEMLYQNEENYPNSVVTAELDNEFKREARNIVLNDDYFNEILHDTVFQYLEYARENAGYMGKGD